MNSQSMPLAPVSQLIPPKPYSRIANECTRADRPRVDSIVALTVTRRPVTKTLARETAGVPTRTHTKAPDQICRGFFQTDIQNDHTNNE